MGFLTINDGPAPEVTSAVPAMGEVQQRLAGILLTRAEKLERLPGVEVCRFCDASAPQVEYHVDGHVFTSLSVHYAVWHWRLVVAEFSVIRDIEAPQVKPIPEDLLLTPPTPKWLRDVLAKPDRIDDALLPERIMGRETEILSPKPLTSYEYERPSPKYRPTIGGTILRLGGGSLDNMPKLPVDSIGGNEVEFSLDKKWKWPPQEYYDYEESEWLPKHRRLFPPLELGLPGSIPSRESPEDVHMPDPRNGISFARYLWDHFATRDDAAAGEQLEDLKSETVQPISSDADDSSPDDEPTTD